MFLLHLYTHHRLTTALFCFWTFSGSVTHLGLCVCVCVCVCVNKQKCYCFTLVPRTLQRNRKPQARVDLGNGGSTSLPDPLKWFAHLHSSPQRTFNSYLCPRKIQVTPHSRRGGSLPSSRSYELSLQMIRGSRTHRISLLLPKRTKWLTKGTGYPRWLSISTPGVHPEELKPHVQTWTWVFIAPFIMATRWKQPNVRCHLNDHNVV